MEQYLGENGMHILVVVLLVIEYALGKTKWVKANSVVETVFNAILKLATFLKLKK